MESKLLAQEGTFDNARAGVTGEVPTIMDLEGVFSNIVRVALGFAGIALFVMLLIGGFNLITAGSEAPKAEAAKKTITYAILGVVFVALAFLILRVIEAITGAEGILQFKITQ